MPPNTSSYPTDVPSSTTTPACDDGARVGPPSSSAEFEIALPDGRRVRNEGNNEWVVPVTPGEPVSLEVTATIAPGVTLTSIAYEVDGPGNRTVHRVVAGAEVVGTLTTTVSWAGRDDGEAIDGGRYHLFAEAVIGHDDRNPCADLTGGQERWGLGYFNLA